MIGTEVLTYVDNTKYLGITFCETLNNDKDMMICQMRLMYAKSNKLLRVFSHCTTDVKFVFFDSCCTFLYCPFLWTDYPKRTFSKLRVAFNNAYRKIFNLPIWSSASTMYAENNICNFKAMLRKSIYRFIQRLQDSDNLLIQCICQSWVMQFSIMEPLD